MADAYIQSYQVYEELQGLVPRLTTARSYLSRGEVPSSEPFLALEDSAREAQTRVEDARFTFRLTESLPFLNRPLKAIELAADAITEEAAAATLTRDILSDALGESSEGRIGVRDPPIFHDGRADIGLIESLPPRLEQLMVHLKAADAKIRAIPHIPLADELDQIRLDASRETQEAIALVENAVKGVRLLPSFLGADKPRIYFLALQNNSDQRATGGDLLAYAFVKVNKGQLTLVKGGSIAEIDQGTGFPGAHLPPEIRWYMQHIPEIRKPRLRHANFTPNFPLVAAAWSSQLAHSEEGMPVDGVISLDPVVIARLIGGQKIDVPSYPRPITGEIAVDVIENKQYLLPRAAQKAFPAELIAASWPLLSEPKNLVYTLQRLGEGLRQRRLHVWTEDAEERDLLSELKWDGGVRMRAGDYLYVTDSKLEPNKVDFYTHVSIEYDVKIQADGTAQSTVEVTLENKTPPDLPTTVVGRQEYGLNRALIAAYVPTDAKLVSVSPKNPPPVHVEGDTRVFLGVTEALPDDRGVVRFTYTVPGVVVESSTGSVYRLRIQHQPMVNLPHLTVRVTLPEGKEIDRAPGWTVTGGEATYSVDLNRDLDLEIRY